MKNVLRKLVMLVAIAMAGTCGLTVNAATPSTVEATSIASNGEKMVLTDTYVEYLDDEFYIEVSDYTTVVSGKARAAAKSVEKARHYTISRKSDKLVMVKLSLHGNFTYNGKTSSCTRAWVNKYNYNPGTYTILRANPSRSGAYAVGDYSVRNTKSGKLFTRISKIGVKPDGTVVKP